METGRTVKDVSPHEFVEACSTPQEIRQDGAPSLDRYCEDWALVLVHFGRYMEVTRGMEAGLHIFARAVQKMEIIDIHPKGGRKITSIGQRDLDQVAGRFVRRWRVRSQLFRIYKELQLSSSLQNKPPVSLFLFFEGLLPAQGFVD
ncbi:hypothetical protein J5N97_008443 [Dioscorea zingiberensis]|uniref:Uncharacterized protein n=1 Tax=Dioscorea zingiberensis TaxID=325984 RepID=A0A9D5CVR7_9LILI|nr:hypothetical protein J5N97_008443 [Dioscorea zingiberensis]